MPIYLSAVQQVIRSWSGEIFDCDAFDSCSESTFQASCGSGGNERSLKTIQTSDLRRGGIPSRVRDLFLLYTVPLVLV